MANTQNLSFYVGEDIPISGVLNPVVDISGWTLRFDVRVSVGALPVLISKTTGAGITIVSGPASTFTIDIMSADTATLTPGAYVYDLQRIDAGFHRMLVSGTLTLVSPATPITPP